MFRHSIDVHVGAKVREQRQRRKLSKRALAQELRTTVADVDKIETGSRGLSANELCKLASLLGVETVHLVQDYVEIEIAGFRLVKSKSRRGRW